MTAEYVLRTKIGAVWSPKIHRS